MRAYRVETTLSDAGRLLLSDLPFKAGERVEIIVLAAESSTASSVHPLLGLAHRYDDPFAPAVDPDDWRR